MNIFGAIADAVGRLGDWVLSWFGGDPRVEQIRSRVAATCQFLPSVASVAAMLSASNPTVTGVVGIATAICAAVTAQKKQLGLVAATLLEDKPLGTVNGVPIEGDFLRGR